jgi:predicted MFS family arabinose efflux permease
VLRRYLHLLSLPGVAPALALNIVGRLPNGMAVLALALLFRHAGMDFGLAGALVAVYGVGTALGGPVLGRLVDYLGQPKVLLFSGAASAAAFAWLALDPTGPLFLTGLLTFLAGALTPPLEACLRSLWPDLVPDERRRDTAYALDAALQEMIFVVAPLLVALVAAAYYPMQAVLATALITVVGAAAFAALRPVRRWRTVPRRTNWLGPLMEARIRQIVACFVFVGCALGVLAIAAVAYAEEVGRPDLAGLLLAANGAGALVGGLSYGMAPSPRAPRARFRLLLCGLALSYLPLLLTPGPWAMAALFCVAGVFLAPVLACTFGLLHRLAPQGTSTEAFAWLVSMFTLGSAAGTSLAGPATDAAGSMGALSTAAVATALAVLLSLRVRPLARRHLPEPATGA